MGSGPVPRPETSSPTLYDTALLHAARNGSERVARFLVSEGADIDRSVNHDNDTPVLIALSGHHRELADFLIAEGAELEQLVLAIEPEDAEGHDLVKRRRWKAVDRRVPDQLGVRDGLDVQH